MMNVSLNKKVIVISGGTKGVGKQLALQCAADGAYVIISGRDEASATDIVSAAKNAPGSIEFKKTDLHSVNSIRNLFAYVAEKYNKLDGFVNYAGITPAASLTECSEALFDDVFDIDIKAAFFCCQEAVKLMQKSGGGSIILVGSTYQRQQGSYGLRLRQGSTLYAFQPHRQALCRRQNSQQLSRHGLDAHRWRTRFTEVPGHV